MKELRTLVKTGHQFIQFCLDRSSDYLRWFAQDVSLFSLVWTGRQIILFGFGQVVSLFSLFWTGRQIIQFGLDRSSVYSLFSLDRFYFTLHI